MSDRIWAKIFAIGAGVFYQFAPHGGSLVLCGLMAIVCAINGIKEEDKEPPCPRE